MCIPACTGQRVSAWGCLPRGSWLPRRVSSQGVSAKGAGMSAQWCVADLPPGGQNDRRVWKHYLAETSLWAVKMWCTILITHPHGERFAYSHISTQLVLCIDEKLENGVFRYITEYMIYTCDDSENERDKAVVRWCNISHYWDKYENTYQSSTVHIIWQWIKKTQTNILIRLLEISTNKIWMEY